MGWPLSELRVARGYGYARAPRSAGLWRSGSAASRFSAEGLDELVAPSFACEVVQRLNAKLLPKAAQVEAQRGSGLSQGYVAQGSRAPWVWSILLHSERGIAPKCTCSTKAFCWTTKSTSSSSPGSRNSGFGARRKIFFFKKIFFNLFIFSFFRFFLNVFSSFFTLFSF